MRSLLFSPPKPPPKRPPPPAFQCGGGLKSLSPSTVEASPIHPFHSSWNSSVNTIFHEDYKTEDEEEADEVMIIENDHHDEVHHPEQGSAAVPQAGAGDPTTAGIADETVGTAGQHVATADPNAGTAVQVGGTADPKAGTAVSNAVSKAGTAVSKAGTAVSKAGTAVSKAAAVDPKTVVIVGNGAVKAATVVVMGNGPRPLVLTPVAKPPNIAALKALRAPELPAPKPKKALPNGLEAASGKGSEPNTDTVVNSSIATAASPTLPVSGSTPVSTTIATTSVTAVGAAATSSSGNGNVAVVPALVNGAVTIPARMKMQLQLPPLSQQKSPTTVGFPPHKPQVNPKVSFTSTEARWYGADS